ncbi:hypothetical protein UP15_06990 [Bacillus pumilus]|uniref:DUF3168 domain-containing protein n=1 Tax=Bacillus TaxID=1386 RepID=UPI0007765C65|nr:DUF3168 domain-containing protein [Bacillus altitudinis]AMM88711.1 hypothetical protein UP15_06990 [Bacillus pumilus]MCI9883888.1 DUF3168 domain-containing protein [Bacillus altitudinis]PYH27195.1 hypothetical protein US8_01976 [Bacillus altitudinis]
MTLMLPIQEVEMILTGSSDLTSYVPDEKVFLVDVPELDQKVDQAPMIRINELESYRNAYEDDQATGISVDIQIDLWTGTIKEAQEIQPIIDRLMASADYQQYASAFDKDPDINLYRYARRFRANKEIEINFS